MIYGILSISKGVELNYPIPPVIDSLSGLCDRVLIGVDPTYPMDRDILSAMYDYEGSNVEFIDSPWKRSIDMGNEIALQMDHLVSTAEERGADWVCVLQADEMFHESDFSMLRRFIGRSEENNDGTTGFSLERLYFWGVLSKVRIDWNARLVRIFKPGYFSFMAENTDKSGMYAGQIKPGKVVDLSYHIYHYSRIGNPADISKRVRNLDSMYHKEKDLIPEDQLPEYDFKGREFDNFNINQPPPEKDMIVVDYNGTHPKGVVEWFRPKPLTGSW